MFQHLPHFFEWQPHPFGSLSLKSSSHLCLISLSLKFTFNPSAARFSAVFFKLYPESRHSSSPSLWPLSPQLIIIFGWRTAVPPNWSACWILVPLSVCPQHTARVILLICYVTPLHQTHQWFSISLGIKAKTPYNGIQGPIQSAPSLIPNFSDLNSYYSPFFLTMLQLYGLLTVPWTPRDTPSLRQALHFPVASAWKTLAPISAVCFLSSSMSLFSPAASWCLEYSI